MLTLGLDVGTQSTKAVVYNAQTKQIIGRGAFPYDIIASSVRGRAEQHPSTWIEGVIGASKQALRDVADVSCIKAIGVSGQQHGMVVLDSQKQVLRPAKLWCDTESEKEAQELSTALGQVVVPSFTITKLLWLKRHEPDMFNRVRHMLLPHDYVNWWLTGRMTMEAGDASGTGLMDVKTRQWSAHRIQLVDERLEGWLPPLIHHNEVVGCLTKASAAALGLSQDVVVSAGSGDNAMSALGSGLVTPGPLIVSLGTSGTLFGKSSAALMDPSGSVCPFCDATGGGLPLLCTLNCTLPVNEVAASLNMSHEQLTALASDEPPGCHGVTFLPYLLGERTPNWPQSTGTILGLRPGLLRPGLLYRAAMEGATFSLVAGLRRVQDLGLQPTELRVVGGGAKNALWRQIIADAFQLPVRQPLEVESAALGAALQAAAAASGQDVAEYISINPPAMSQEVVQPNKALAGAYKEAIVRFEQLGKQLFASHAA